MSIAENQCQDHGVYGNRTQVTGDSTLWLSSLAIHPLTRFAPCSSGSRSSPWSVFPAHPVAPAHGVASALQRFGYRIIPVNPRLESALGEQVYPDLRSVPEPIDLVDVFRLPEHVAAIVDECIALRLPALWLQDGVIDETAALRAEAAGIQVVMNRCIYRDYLQYVGTVREPPPLAPRR